MKSILSTLCLILMVATTFAVRDEEAISTEDLSGHLEVLEVEEVEEALDQLSAQTTVQGMAGIITAALNIALPLACDSIDGMHVPDYNYTSGSMMARASNITLQECTYSKFNVVYRKATSDYLISLVNFSQSGSLDYWAKKSLLSMSGHLDWAAIGVNVTMGIKLTYSWMVPHPSLTVCNVGITAIKGKFSKSMWSWLLNWMTSVINSLRVPITNIISDEIATAVNDTLTN